MLRGTSNSLSCKNVALVNLPLKKLKLGKGYEEFFFFLNNVGGLNFFLFVKYIVFSKSSQNFTGKKCGAPTNLDLFKANKKCHVSPLWLFRLDDKCVCNKSFRVKFY